MSDFDRFKFLELFASPQKGKRKRSTSRNRSKNSSERRKPTKIQKNEESENVLKTSAKLETKVTETTPSSDLKKQLSRTNLEQKYDSPDKSLVHNISCDEDNFIYQPAPKKESTANQFFGANYAQNAANLKLDRYSPDIYCSEPTPFDFPSEEEVLKQLPQTLNSRLESLISSFKSPARKPPKPNGCIEKFTTIMKKRKKDSLKGYKDGIELKEGEKKIKLISIVPTSKTHYLIKFTFLDEMEQVIEDGNENLASLRVLVHGQIIKQYSQFIVRISHSIEFKKSKIMHDIEHMRAF